MPPRLFVTGASGLLGANFALAATARFQVTACHGRHRLALPAVENVACDLRQPGEVARLLGEARPDIIAHLAAATDVERCQTHPDEAEEINVRVAERLAGWAAGNGTRFLLMSTDAVFDGRRGGYTETDEPSPVNVYAATKVEAERRVCAAGPNHLIVRANLYGWNAQPKQSLAEWVLARLESGQSVPGFTDIRFAPLLVNSLANIMLAALEHGARGTYHAASRDALSKYEFARAIADTFGLPRDLVAPAKSGEKLRTPRSPDTTLVATRLSEQLGIALPSVAEDLQRFRRLRDTGFVAKLKAAYQDTHEHD